MKNTTKSITIENFAKTNVTDEEYQTLQTIANLEGFKTVNDLATIIVIKETAELLGNNMTLKETANAFRIFNIKQMLEPELSLTEFLQNYKNN